MDNNSGATVNDDELNKMIANLSGGTAAGATTLPPVPTPPAENSGMPVIQPLPQNPAPTTSAVPVPAAPVQTIKAAAVSTPASTGLDGIKDQALTELRPLVDKLNLAPEDKFDVLLLMIRSTDDKSLIPEAHKVAQQIADDSRKAQALLDIIKEIDFFDQNK